MVDPGDLARPEQATTGFGQAFTQAAYQLNAGHEMAKQAFSQRQMHQDDLAELHRQALETARSEQPRQEQAMREQPGRDDAMYPERAVLSGIEAAAKSGHDRGYRLGLQHAAARHPRPCQGSRARVRRGRRPPDPDQPGYRPCGRGGRVVSAPDNLSPYQFHTITSDSGSLIDADLAAMPGGGDEHAQTIYDLAHAHASTADAVRAARGAYPLATRLGDFHDAAIGMGAQGPGRSSGASYGARSALLALGHRNDNPFQPEHVPSPEATGRGARDWISPY